VFDFETLHNLKRFKRTLEKTQSQTTSTVEARDDM